MRLKVTQRWTQDELKFLAQFGPDVRPVDIYQDYKNLFGHDRSYHSVQKKVKSLWEYLEKPQLQVQAKKEDLTPEEQNTPYAKSKYVFLESEDEYLIPTKKGMLHVDGDRIRKLVDNYSNYGHQKTRNMVAREFGWARDAIIDALAVLGKTHDSAPFTDEHILYTSEEELVADVIRKKEHKILVKADKILQKQLEKDAEKWRNIHKSVEEVFDQKRYVPLPARTRFNLEKARRPFDIILYHTDAHVGKLAQGWSYNETRGLILKTAERALQHAVAYGTPNRIITGIGGDWSNIDTPRNTTTRGTPQYGNAEWYEIMDGANQITLDLLTLMQDVAPVEAYTVPGNHDRMWSVLAGSWLSKMFKNHPVVKIHTFQHRHYIESGKNMIMLTHGDGAKPQDYPALMAAEAAEIWGRTKFRYAYHGHFHHEISREFAGATVTQMPSIAPKDDWHAHMGYTGMRRALAAHVHDHSGGRVANFNIGISDSGEILG